MRSVIAALAQTAVNDGVLGGAMEPFNCEVVLPMVAYLVSDRCALTSEMYSAGGERFARAGTGVTGGWNAGAKTPSAEELVEHVAEIRGEEDHVLRSSAVAEAELARSPA
jgi:hypothetical protein